MQLQVPAWLLGIRELFLLKAASRQPCLWGLNCTGPVFSYKLRYIVGFWLVEIAISTNQKPTIYRNLYENTAPAAELLLLVPFGCRLTLLPAIRPYHIICERSNETRALAQSRLSFVPTSQKPSHRWANADPRFWSSPDLWPELVVSHGGVHAAAEHCGRSACNEWQREIGKLCNAWTRETLSVLWLAENTSAWISRRAGRFADQWRGINMLAFFVGLLQRPITRPANLFSRWTHHSLRGSPSKHRTSTQCCVARKYFCIRHGEKWFFNLKQS